ncbi:MAG: hypothetical protein AAF672_11190 [Pseudomonadota bacterium]
MTPKIALNLSQDGIVLLHRAEDGSGWYEEGRVTFEKDDIDAGLNAMRAHAAQLAGEDFETKLILPHTQLLFATLDLDRDVGAELEARTPYKVDQLSFDVNASGEKMQVVAVAMETLGEAEGFISKYNFNPVGFTAIPKPGQFDGEPMLGGTLTGPDRFETDKKAVKLLGKRPPKAPPKPTPKPKSTAPIAAAAPTKSPAAFASRRTSSSPDAPVATQERAAPTPPKIAVPQSAPKLGAAERKAAPVAPVKNAKPAPTVPPAVPKRDVPKPVLSASAPVAPKPVVAKADTVVSEKADPIAQMAEAESRGKPRFLGLILTAILLVCLGLAALLSSYLLPPESVSNWFGDDDAFLEELIAEQDDAVAPETPDIAVTEAPLSLPEELDLASLPLGQTLPGAIDPNALDEETDLLPEPEAIEAPAFDAASEDEAVPVAPAPMTEDELLAAYAATGIWQKMEPFAAQVDSFSTLDNLYIASLPPKLEFEDPPVLLPPLDASAKLELASVMPPPPPGILFDLDARGLVRATPEGAISPLGHLVFLGQPPVPARPRPTEDAPEASLPVEAEPEISTPDPEELRLAAFRPAPRPSDFADQLERERFGGNTLSELAQFRPVPRPASAQAQAEAIARALAEAEAESTGTAIETATEFAVAASLRARQRPADFSTIVAQAQRASPASRPSGSAQASLAQPNRATGPAVSRASRAQPTGPVSRTVARAATETNAIALGRVSLVGIFGTSANRRALVRMPNGRFVKVSVGDRVDGGRVAAIGASSLQYVKGGRNLTLNMPQG